MSNQKLVNGVASGLAWELKYIRKGCGLTLDDVCLKLKWPLSKLSRMEGGQQCISEADLASVLVLYQVTGKERQRLIHLADRQDDPGRWDSYTHESAVPSTFFRLEPEAHSIVYAEPILVPGLAQTADYTRAVMEAANVPTEQVQARVDLRMSRKALLTKSKPPKVDMIVDEIALRRVVGSHKVMAQQLRVLAEMAERQNVRLWIIPFELGGSAGFDKSFCIMHLPHEKSVVFQEAKESDIYLEDQAKVDTFMWHAARLGKIALNRTESIEFLATMATGARSGVRCG